MRVLFQTNIPAPYRVDFFNELGKYCELTVLFEAKSSKNRNAAWVADKMENFTPVFLKRIKIGKTEAICPGIIKYLSKEKYDMIVISVYASPTGMLAIEHMRLHRIPFILSSDGGMIKDDAGMKERIKRHFIGAASAWLSTGKTTTEYLTHYGADAKRVYGYPFTSVRKSDILEHPLTKAKKQEYRDFLGMREEKIVLSVGQFIHRKGYDILLKACKELDASVGVYIVGGKPTEEYLRLKEELGLEHVHFVDFMTKDKLANYYKAADLFVLPTREDIWGLVVNEAMANGLPVVSTDKCIAAMELIEDGVNGYIVPPENPDAIAEKVNYLVGNDRIRLAQGQEALMKIKEYSIESMAKVHAEMFESLQQC